MQAGDLMSLAIATAGRILSFTVNDNRVPEAAALAVGTRGHGRRVLTATRQTKSIILIAGGLRADSPTANSTPR